MKKTGLAITLVAIIAALASPSFARTLVTFDDDAPIDVEQYCQANYGAGASTVSDDDPYSWYCGDSDATLGDDDMAAACDQQYGAGWVPVLVNELDAHSWTCTFEG